MADDLTAILEHIRDGAESEITHPDDECGVEAGGFCTPHGALRAVAALRAVLELADEWEEGSFKLDVGAAVMDGCARELREAITRKLTGKGESDAPS